MWSPLHENINNSFKLQIPWKVIEKFLFFIRSSIHFSFWMKCHWNEYEMLLPTLCPNRFRMLKEITGFYLTQFYRRSSHSIILVENLMKRLNYTVKSNIFCIQLLMWAIVKCKWTPFRAMTTPYFCTITHKLRCSLHCSICRLICVIKSNRNEIA